MTTIAFDEFGVATDTGTFEGDMYVGNTSKIYANENFILAWTGDASEKVPMFEWYANGADASNAPARSSRDGLLIAFTPNGVFEYEYASPTPYKSSFKRFAYGGGRAFAVGALYAGASAVQAVEAAIYFHVCTAGEVRYMPFPWLEARVPQVA